MIWAVWTAGVDEMKADPATRREDYDPTCSFCRKKKLSEGAFLIRGLASTRICDECVELCVEILEDRDDQSLDEGPLQSDHEEEPGSSGLEER